MRKVAPRPKDRVQVLGQLVRPQFLGGAANLFLGGAANLIVGFEPGPEVHRNRGERGIGLLPCCLDAGLDVSKPVDMSGGTEITSKRMRNGRSHGHMFNRLMGFPLRLVLSIGLPLLGFALLAPHCKPHVGRQATARRHRAR